jgi:Fe-S cluster assembly iron-binding protein IscA
MNRLIPFAFVLLAGCSSKPTAEFAQAPSPARGRAFAEIEPASARILAKLAEAQGFGPGWCVRLEVVWSPEAEIHVDLDRKPPGPDDFSVESEGLTVVMSNVQKEYLKGARVTYFEVQQGAGFDVTFPNRTDRDRELANEWLKAETSKRKGKP